MKNQLLRRLLLVIAASVALSSVYLEQVHTVEDSSSSSSSSSKTFKSEDGHRVIKVKVDTHRTIHNSLPGSTTTVTSVSKSEPKSVTQQPVATAPSQAESPSTSSLTIASDQKPKTTVADTLHDNESAGSNRIADPKSTTRPSNSELDHALSDTAQSVAARAELEATSPAVDFPAANGPSERSNEAGEVPEFPRNVPAEFSSSVPLESDRPLEEEEVESGQHQVELVPEGDPTEQQFSPEDFSESFGSNIEGQLEHEPAPINERVEEIYIDDSDPNDPKQVHHVKEVHSSVTPSGESYSQSDSKTSNSIGANPNYHSKHYSSSKVSSSSSSSYSDGIPDYYTQPFPGANYGKPGKRRRHRNNHKYNKPAYPVYGYPNPAYRLSQPFPSIPPMPKMPRVPYMTKMYPMAIFPPIPNLPHAPKIPPAWANLANRGIAYGYAYPPAYAVASTGKSAKTGAKNVAYAYAKANRSGAAPYGQTKKPKKSSKRKRRHSSRRNQDSQVTLEGTLI